MLTIAKFDRYDLVNTPMSDTAAFTIWFSGCHFRCKGCYNERLWYSDFGAKFTVDDALIIILNQCESQGLHHVVLLGGEPLDQDFVGICELLDRLYSYGIRIWLYTGYEFNEIPPPILQTLYTVKCGVYKEDLKCDGIPSSTNQKFYRKIDEKWNEITF